jgi:flagellar basal-body rod protein FlgB
MDIYDLTKKALDISSLRGKVIANNIANVNTKGYKRYYVNFEDNLNSETAKIQVKQDSSTSMNEDGNNVDIDSEMVDQASNNLMYNALISDINTRLSIQSYVIKEGKG